jgi:hypothetical protein
MKGPYDIRAQRFNWSSNKVRKGQRPHSVPCDLTGSRPSSLARRVLRNLALTLGTIVLLRSIIDEC